MSELFRRRGISPQHVSADAPRTPLTTTPTVLEPGVELDAAPPEAARAAHTKGPPEVPPQTPQLLLETLIEHRASAAQLREAHDRLVDRLSAMETPAQIQAAVINPNNIGSYTTELEEEVAQPTLSVGILNPNPITAYWSPFGSAQPNVRAYSTPPNALLVLPIGIGTLEVGCAPADLGANTAVLFVIRYFSVQPAFLGRGA